MPSPSLHITNFADERCRFDSYWSRLRELDVPVPKTTFVALETDEDGIHWETDDILAFMERNEYDRAFVRTQVKAATVRLRDGSFIYRRDPEVIDDVVESLLTQNLEQGWPHGDGLVVREWLDFDFCIHPKHNCHPSVRFFVEDGEVLGHTPMTAERATNVCDDTYDYLEPVIADVDLSAPRRYAERIADAFSVPWGVDFIMDTTGTWYCPELNFDGVYWNRAEEKWWNMCGQGEFEPWSPVEVHSAALYGTKPETERSESVGATWW
ncbi:hypothetical protein A4G99_08070 [Haladaptatus sp. R4]|uniref:hypothetical protein n=1 Tax=Haladaptatus sp. R4 TaxID=1679489 RepID=UPI0007B4BDD8|nr:hypothetical protein [Haladaptatus sp. R4]KZN24353.1 hypothetical protein A4G99_08070 [Haladaptatus sp. R4]